MKIAAQKFNPAAIILFGSRARGDHLIHSDYDFIIVSAAFEGVRWLDRVTALARLWVSDENVDLLPYTPEEFVEKQQHYSTVRSAMRDAIAVYGKINPVASLKGSEA